MTKIEELKKEFSKKEEKIPEKNTFKSVEEIANMGINKTMVYRTDILRRKKKLEDNDS